jgi:catechol 2,3-dioxygenase-like lactoylglutathione lyase family enzyme
MFRVTTIVAVLAAAGASVGGHAAQGENASGPAPQPRPGVQRTGNFSPIVQDLDRSLAFYQGLLGLEVPQAPGSSPKPFSVNPGLHAMLGTTGARERHSNARIPGTSMGVEMVEFADIPRTPAHEREQDPGAVTLVLLVRDLDSLLAQVKAAGVRVLTPRGIPVQGPGRTRAVLVQDPDGRAVELRQPDLPPATSAPESSNIVGARLSMTVADTDTTRHIYRDVLGFEVRGDDTFGPDPALLALTGLERGRVRRTFARAPRIPRSKRAASTAT